MEIKEKAVEKEAMCAGSDNGTPTLKVNLGKRNLGWTISSDTKEEQK